jgi:4-amino-4-deoxy-L-arabinose transferase-like glycosyltransferase
VTAGEGGAARAPWLKSDWVFALFLFVLALALRVLVVHSFGERPMWDGHFYHQGAVRIAEGHGYSEDALINGQLKWMPWSHYPVGYSALLGVVYRVFGPDPAFALVTNAVVGAFITLVGFGLARELLSQRRARAAGLLIALHPGLILYCTLLMTELLAALLVLSSAYVARAHGQRRWAPVVSGLLVAASALVRPQSLFFAPLLVLLFPGRVLVRLRQTALTGIVSLLAIAPWSIRNCRVLDGCALISTNGGWNLAIGALSETGRFRALTPEDGCRDAITPVVQDRCWANVGWQRIEQDPLAWLAHIPDKLRHTYNHESFAVAYLAEANPGYWYTERKHRAMNLNSAFHHLLMLGAAFAAISRLDRRAWRQRQVWVQAMLVTLLIGFTAYAAAQPERPMYWVGVVLPLLGLLRLPGSPPLGAGMAYLYATIAVTSLTHMVFFGDDRYHLAISPTLCLLAAAALRRPAKRCERERAALDVRGEAHVNAVSA